MAASAEERRAERLGCRAAAVAGARVRAGRCAAAAGRPAANAAGAGRARALQRGPRRLPHKWKQMREWRRRGWGAGRPPGPRRGCAGHCAAATGRPAANAAGAEGVHALQRGRAGFPTNGSK